jgi:hypothetical protein
MAPATVAARYLVIGAACLLLFGCAFGPPSADVAFGGSPTPPAALPAPGPAGARDGVYVGTANVSASSGYTTCQQTMNVTGFRVDGNVVRFGGFRGTIADNGRVAQTFFRGMWFAGQFVGPKFLGYVDASQGSTTQTIGCVYGITVTRLPA